MENPRDFEKRKIDHIKWSLSEKTQNLSSSEFEKIGLKHEALPNIDFSEIDVKQTLLNHTFSTPLFVSSMTAGHKDGYKINDALATACAENNWLFAVGSQKKELTNKPARDEWTSIKKNNPGLKCLSNIGIEEVSLYDHSSIYKIVDSLGAIGLIVHLNPLQEVFQNKKDVYFKNAQDHLKKFIKYSPVPVIIKEVGFGIGLSTAEKLWSMGAAVVDVAGSGGTHWAAIEALRQPQISIQSEALVAFADWGYPTASVLKHYYNHQRIKNIKQNKKKNEYWASGGIRDGVQSFKALALGARAVGIAQPFIVAATLSAKKQSQRVDRITHVMKRFEFELKTALFCTGLKNINELKNKKVWYEK